jgi:CHAD domain-containing protein
MLEVEAKFRVGAVFDLPDLTGDRTGITAVEGPRMAALDAVYWDTSDLRLAREGITLRYRTGEGDDEDGWHLKLPVHEAGVPDGSTGAREELHDLDCSPDSVPPSMRSLVEVHLRGAVIGPVATLVTTRSSYDLLDAVGTRVAELTDDLVSVLNLGHVAGRFREIEVEDCGGGVTVLDDVGVVLRAAGAVGGEFVPKVVRALGPQATADPDPPKPMAVDLRDPARSAMQAVLRRYVRALMANDPTVRRGRPDGVHQMRVAARRIRSALKTFGPLVDADWSSALRAELKWLADSLGAARDAEVMLARLHAELDALSADAVVGPVRAKLDAAVGSQLAAAERDALAVLDSDRYLALVDRLVAAAWDPMTTPLAEAPAGDVLPHLVGHAWRRLAKGARRLRRADAVTDDWHDVRKVAKQARYSAEAVSPFYGKPARRLARQAEAVQELLGEHQDAVITAELVRSLATVPRAGSFAFTLGVIHCRQQAVIDRTRDEFPALWKAANRSRHRKWLRS